MSQYSDVDYPRLKKATCCIYRGKQPTSAPAPPKNQHLSLRERTLNTPPLAIESTSARQACKPTVTAAGFLHIRQDRRVKLPFHQHFPNPLTLDWRKYLFKCNKCLKNTFKVIHFLPVSKLSGATVCTELQHHSGFSFPTDCITGKTIKLQQLASSWNCLAQHFEQSVLFDTFLSSRKQVLSY